MNNIDNDDVVNFQTPISSPRDEPVCPGAPKKMIKCEGCRIMLEYGTGGENQQAHMGPGGCLEQIFDDEILYVTRKLPIH